MAARLRVGDVIEFDGNEGTIVVLSSDSATVRMTDSGRFVSMLIGDWITHVQAGPRDGDVMPDLSVAAALAGDAALAKAELLAAHVREVETGYRSGDPTRALRREPRPEFDPSRTMAERMQAKVAELEVAPESAFEGMSLGALRRYRANYRDQGIAGLVDKRRTRAHARFGRQPAELVELVRAQAEAEHDDSDGDAERFYVRLQVAASQQEPPIKVPCRQTVRMILDDLGASKSLQRSASTRRKNPVTDRVYTPVGASYPGHICDTDATPIDCFTIHNDGEARRAQLTVFLDVYSRSILSWRITEKAPRAVDAAELLADAITPVPMREGFEHRRRFEDLNIPFERAVSLDERLRQASAHVHLLPERLHVDGGKIFVSSNFLTACSRLGVSVHLARPYTGSDKAVVERTFKSIRTLFVQYVAGYLGPNTERRGKKVGKNTDGLLTTSQLEALFGEWVMVEWQHRPHKGLRIPFAPDRDVTPTEMYEFGVAVRGYIPVPANPDEYLRILPTEFRTISPDGISVGGRTYNSAVLNPYRNRPSPYPQVGGKWPIRVHASDVSQIFFQEPDTGAWHAIPWLYASELMQAPFGATTWKAVFASIRDQYQRPTQIQVKNALKNVLVAHQTGAELPAHIERALSEDERRRDETSADQRSTIDTSEAADASPTDWMATDPNEIETR